MYGKFGEPYEKTWVFDPLGLATIGTDRTTEFFRSAELKHGRIAMMACLGWIHHLAHIQFPGMLSISQKVSFADLGAMTPTAAWAAMPKEGVYSIFGAIAIPELYAMTHKG